MFEGHFRSESELLGSLCDYLNGEEEVSDFWEFQYQTWEGPHISTYPKFELPYRRGGGSHFDLDSPEIWSGLYHCKGLFRLEHLYLDRLAPCYYFDFTKDRKLPFFNEEQNSEKWVRTEEYGKAVQAIVETLRKARVLHSGLFPGCFRQEVPWVWYGLGGDPHFKACLERYVLPHKPKVDFSLEGFDENSLLYSFCGSLDGVRLGKGQKIEMQVPAPSRLIEPYLNVTTLSLNSESAREVATMLRGLAEFCELITRQWPDIQNYYDELVNHDLEAYGLL